MSGKRADAKFDPERYRTSEARGIFNDSQRYSTWADWATRFKRSLTEYDKANAFRSFQNITGKEYKAALAIARENPESAVHILIEHFQGYGWIAPVLLRQLTGANPVPASHHGRFLRIAVDWITWSEDLMPSPTPSEDTSPGMRETPENNKDG